MSPENSPNEIIVLRDAAVRAHRELVGAGVEPPDGVLDVVAIALAACIRIFGARAAEETLHPLTDEEVAGGRFVHGAAQMQFGDGRRPFTQLAMRQSDLGDAIARLKRAGVNFSHARFEPSPRRVPKVLPVSA